MLVIITEDQLLSPQKICRFCLLADPSGQPRWRAGHLGCGRLVHPHPDNQPEQYDCQMGFRVAHVE